MRLGTSSPLRHETPEEWAQNQVRLGCRTVVFPVQSNEPEAKILAYKDAADRAQAVAKDLAETSAEVAKAGLAGLKAGIEEARRAFNENLKGNDPV